MKALGDGFAIDEKKLEEEARFDDKWVLRTNTTLSAADVALKSEELCAVEALIRASNSLLETRPISHKRDDTIRGHVFCLYLALVLMKELDARLEAKGDTGLEWNDIIRDLDRLEEVEITQDGKRFLLRTSTKRTCGKTFCAAGVAVPPTQRQVSCEPEES